MMKFIVLLVSIIVTAFPLIGMGSLEFTAKVGITVPNDELGQMYDSRNNTEESDNLIIQQNSGATAGWTVGFKALMPLSNLFHAYIHAGIHELGENNYTIYSEEGQQEGFIVAEQFIIPAGMGMEMHLLDSAATDLYFTGQINFNYLSSYNKTLTSLEGPSSSNIGYGLGIGSNFDLGLLGLNIEVLFSALNLSESNRGLKTLTSLTIGMTF